MAKHYSNNKVPKDTCEALSNELRVKLDKIIDSLYHYDTTDIPKATQNPALKLIDLYFVLDESRRALTREATSGALLECQVPLVICGDTHGQLSDVWRLFTKCGLPPTTRYLFLGDYVDRGHFSIETACLMICYHLRYPTAFYIIRGNHESSWTNRSYGFLTECTTRYGLDDGRFLWASFQLVFDFLPLAALVSNRILCMHGGLSPSLESLMQLRHMSLPIMVPNASCLATDLLWSDPCRTIKGYVRSNRGVSYLFGEDVVTSFCKKHNIDLIVRAHQVVLDGYEIFGKSQQLITLFSAPNYCNQFHNKAGMLSIDNNMNCVVKELEPKAP